MKDKYSILNDVKVNIDEYKEVKFDNNDNIKQRMKKKLRSRKSSYRKVVAVASAVILSTSIILNENIWAQVQSIWYTVDEVFNLKKDEVKQYSYNIDKTVEDKNIKILFKSITFDNGSFIIDTNIDDTKFNPLEDFTEQQKKDWFVDKWANEETKVLLGADSTEIYMDGVKLTYFNNSAPNSNDKNDDGTTDVLIEQLIYDKDSYKDEFPNNIDISKIYNLKIKIKKLYISESDYTEEESQTREGNYGGVIEGDWSINVDIKGEELIDASTNFEINKEIDLQLDDRKIDVLLDNVSISPLYLGLDYSYTNEYEYSIEFKVFNDKGEEYRCVSVESDSYTDKKNKSKFDMKLINSFKDTKFIKLVPVIINYQNGKTIIFEEKAIKVEINR